MGAGTFVQRQLHPESIDDRQCDERIAPYLRRTLGRDYRKRLKLLEDEKKQEVERMAFDTLTTTLLRQTHSKRQLFERATQFWHHHFNVFFGKEDAFAAVFTDWDAAIRSHALGNFRAMLEATARHPVMLIYLDNAQSTVAGPNENYARELLELHTLGAMHYQKEGGYADDDVYEVSRCFTGWSIEDDVGSAKFGTFNYNHETHDRFQKIVLGESIPRDQKPMADGLQVLDRLASHPGTAKYIATKLCTHFISDNPPDSIVESTAAVFLKAIRAPDQIALTLAHIFESESFLESAQMKFKTPHEWMISMFRILEMEIPESEEFQLGEIMEILGDPLFHWRTPDGPPDNAESWVTTNSLLYRWRIPIELAQGAYADAGFKISTAEITPKEMKTPQAISDWWTRRLLGARVRPETAHALALFLADGQSLGRPMPREKIRERVPTLVALAVTSPEFNRR